MQHLYEVEYSAKWTSPGKRPMVCVGTVNVVANGSAESAVNKAKRLALGRFFNETKPSRRWTCTTFKYTGVKQMSQINNLTD